MEYHKKKNVAIDGGAKDGGGEARERGGGKGGEGGGGGVVGQGQGQERGLRFETSLASASRNDGGSGDAKPPKLLWPSERIPQGGLFHEPKVVYSKETADLVKLLMTEANISMAMRKKIGEHMRNGEPLPRPRPPPALSRASREADADVQHILWRARIAKRKSLNKILASGAYDQPMYRPILSNRMSSDKDKMMLQEAMSGMRLADINIKPKRRPRPLDDFEEQTPQQLIDELFDQITERADWLAEMEELGQGRKYRDEIREQIAARLRRIKALEAEIEMKKEGFRFIN